MTTIVHVVRSRWGIEAVFNSRAIARKYIAQLAKDDVEDMTVSAIGLDRWENDGTDEFYAVEPHRVRKELTD